MCEGRAAVLFVLFEHVRVAVPAGGLHLVNGFAGVRYQAFAGGADGVAVETGEVVGIGSLSVRDEADGCCLPAIAAGYAAAGGYVFHCSTSMKFFANSIMAPNKGHKKIFDIGKKSVDIYRSLE
jgi:hypothetical protein